MKRLWRFLKSLRRKRELCDICGEEIYRSEYGALYHINDEWGTMWVHPLHVIRSDIAELERTRARPTEGGR